MDRKVVRSAAIPDLSNNCLQFHIAGNEHYKSLCIARSWTGETRNLSKPVRWNDHAPIDGYPDSYTRLERCCTSEADIRTYYLSGVFSVVQNYLAFGTTFFLLQASSLRSGCHSK